MAFRQATEFAAVKSEFDLVARRRLERARDARSEEFTDFLLDLASAIETRVWHETPEQLIEFLRPARALAAPALDRRLKKAKRSAKHFFKLDAAERHALRIALKNCATRRNSSPPNSRQNRSARFSPRLAGSRISSAR
jgi:hypothetical protein